MSVTRRLVRALVVVVVPFFGCIDGDQDSAILPERLATTSSELTEVGWTSLSRYPGVSGPGCIQLLMDGSILAEDGETTSWHRFIPDPVGGYAAGAWVPAASSHYGRAGFATGMLRDGRYFVGGGEYVLNGDGTTNNQHDHCEIYNPFTDKWSDTPDYPTDTYLADGIAAPLPDGTLLVGAPAGDTNVFDASQCPFDGSPCLPAAWNTPDNLPGAPGGTAPGTWPFFSEGSLTPLQNGNILLSEQYYRTDIDANVSGAAVYSWNGPSPKWTVLPHGASQGPVNDPFNGAIMGGEGASALTLYNGQVLITSATGFNALYDPTPGNPNPIQNVATTPGGLNMAENDQVVMPTGNLLCVVNQPSFMGLYTFYEYSPPSTTSPLGVFLSVPSGGPAFTSGNVLQTLLPDGTVMVAGASSGDIYIYRPSGPPVSTGQATITSVAGFINGVYTLSGTNLNGLTNGANRDDEGQNFTSFPIVEINSGAQTWYGSVTNLSTMSIIPNTQEVAEFKMPPAVPQGPVTVSVSSSGLQSANSVVLSNSLWLPSPAQQLLIL